MIDSQIELTIWFYSPTVSTMHCKENKPFVELEVLETKLSKGEIPPPNAENNFCNMSILWNGLLYDKNDVYIDTFCLFY